LFVHPSGMMTMTSLVCRMLAMCPNVADKADLGMKSSVAVWTWKSSNNHGACFRSTRFAEQSLFFSLAYPGLFIGLSSLPDQVPPSAARLSQHTLLIS